MTLFRKKANPKLESTGMDPVLQRKLCGLVFLGVVSSGAPELGVVPVHLGSVHWLTASLFMHLTTQAYIE